MRLRDVGTTLNLNRASEEELRRLLRALRVDFGRADRIAQAVLDWRDPDDEHRARGAERAAYREAGSPMLPRNGPFQNINELRFVRGVDQELLRRLRSYVTVLGTGRVNVNAAPREVLLALEGMTEEAVAVLFRFRQQARPVPNMNRLLRELSAPARRAVESRLAQLVSRTTFDTREVAIVSEGWVDGGIMRARAEGLLVRAATAAFLVWSRIA